MTQDVRPLTTVAVQHQADAVIVATQAPIRIDQRPLYAQASEALRALVQGGGYVPGDRLPSEIELSQQLGISRPTLREALHQLEEEGAIVRRHGVGTFVAQSQPVIESGLEVLESIERMASRGGLHVQMGEAVISERMTTAEESEGMALVAPEPVTCVVRVILAEGKPVAHLTDVLPQRVLRQAELGEGFHGSVLDLLLERGWPALSHSRTELISEAAEPNLARALHVQRGAPLMRLEAHLFAADGQIVDYSVSHFVPGCFRFHVVRRVAGA
jgi:GntR family transcriptional regulator